jgi:hypothetical protein
MARILQLAGRKAIKSSCPPEHDSTLAQSHVAMYTPAVAAKTARHTGPFDRVRQAISGVLSRARIGRTNTLVVRM